MTNQGHSEYKYDLLREAGLKLGWLNECVISRNSWSTSRFMYDLLICAFEALFVLQQPLAFNSRRLYV